jgi:hypothetical protein
MDFSEPLTPAQRQARRRQEIKIQQDAAAERLVDAEERARLATDALVLQTNLVIQLTEQRNEEREFLERSMAEIEQLRAAQLKAQQLSEVTVAELQRQLDTERERTSKLQLETERQRAEQAEGIADERGVRRMLRAVNQEMEQQDGVIADLESKLDELNNANEALRTDVGRLEGEVAHLNEDLTDAQVGLGSCRIVIRKRTHAGATELEACGVAIAKRQKKRRRQACEVELVLALLGNGVLPSQINAAGQLFRTFFLTANPGVELSPSPRITHRLACKYRQFLLSSVVQIVATMRIASPSVRRLELHSDGTGVRSHHYGASLVTGITEDDNTFTVCLEGYEMLDGKAATIAKCHESTFERSRGFLEELLYHAADVCPEVDPEQVRLSFLSAYVTDHASNEKAAGKLLQAKMIDECIERQRHDEADEEPCENCKLLCRFCNQHKRTNLEDDGIRIGETNFFHFHSLATLHTLHLEGCPKSQLGKERFIKKLLENIEPQLDLNGMVRGIYHAFGYGVNPYEFGNGLTFRQWIEVKCPEKLPFVHLVRIVGSRNDCYWENAPLIYTMWYSYLEFLIEEREVRWGKEGPSELNKLQTSLIDSLTWMPLRAALRGRGQWFYVLFDPLRFLSSVASLPEMANHWSIVGQFLTRVAETGGKVMVSRRAAELFDYEPRVVNWRKEKMCKSPTYAATIDALYREDEVDGLMPMYHTNVACGMVEKFAAMTFDQDEFQALSPEQERNMKGCLLTNDVAERMMGHLKYMCQLSTISSSGANAVAAARFNGLFHLPDGDWWKLSVEQRASVIELAYQHWDENAKRQTQMKIDCLQAAMKRREENRQLWAKKEEIRVAKLAEVSKIQKITTVEELDKRANKIKAGQRPSSELKKLLTGQIRIRRLAERRKDAGVPHLSVSDDTKPSGRRNYTADELLDLTRTMIQGEASLPANEEQILQTLIGSKPLLEANQFIPQLAVSQKVRAALEAERLALFHAKKSQATIH